MVDLREFKKAIVLYSMHSPFVKKMLSSWSLSHRLLPKDWIELVKAALEPNPQCQ